jgi:hypothetical protein
MTRLLRYCDRRVIVFKASQDIGFIDIWIYIFKVAKPKYRIPSGVTSKRQGKTSKPTATASLNNFPYIGSVVSPGENSSQEPRIYCQEKHRGFIKVLYSNAGD